MAKFEVHWTAEGSAVIEADDPQEAEDLLHDGLRVLDTSMFESFDVDDTTVESVTEE